MVRRRSLFGPLFIPCFHHPSQLITAAVHMIRRNPTLIPLSDLEIQDVRDMYNKQKMEREKQEELLRKVKMVSQNPELLKEDPQMLDNLTKGMAVTLKDKKQEDKAKRLGLDESKLPIFHYESMI